MTSIETVSDEPEAWFKLDREGGTLSLGGAFIESSLRPAFNTRVQLAIRVPYRSRPIDVGGVVRWSDARGFGVQFDGLRAHDVWVLGKFFEQQSAPMT